MQNEVSADALATAQENGVFVVDVRERSEFATGTVSGAVSIPAGEIRRRLYELPRRSTVYLLCANGARSGELVPFMRAAGYDAYSVAGGIWAWLARGSGAATG